MKMKIIAIFLAGLLILSCTTHYGFNNNNNDNNQTMYETFSVYNYTNYSYNIYLDNVTMAGVSSPHKKTVFIGKLEGNHTFYGTSSNNSANGTWGPYNFYFTQGGNQYVHVGLNQSNKYIDSVNAIIVTIPQ